MGQTCNPSPFGGGSYCAMPRNRDAAGGDGAGQQDSSGNTSDGSSSQDSSGDGPTE
jgi:hypothetical protein